MKNVALLAMAALLAFTSMPAIPAAETAQAADNWPQWRGPFFNGMARGDAPLNWSDTTSVKWKVPIPGRGFSTPAIWGDRIFLTTAVPTGRVDRAIASVTAGHPAGGRDAGVEQTFIVICLDRATGRTLWERVARKAIPHEGHHRLYGSFASNSPVTDGQYVFASFGSRGIYCYDFDGKLIWEKDPGIRLQMRNEFGEGAPPALDGNILVQTYDQESDSAVIAFDKRNGKVIWRKSRDEASSWSTPIFVERDGRKQVIVSASKKTRAYDAESGNVLWECAGLGFNVIPAPVTFNDSVLVMSGFINPNLMAIRLGGRGDLSGSNSILWSVNRATSYTPSPLLAGNLLYVLTDSGMLSCYDAATGKPFYQQKRLPSGESFKASPVGAGGKIYLAGESGTVTVVRMGEQFEVLASNTLTDQFFVSSPVIVGGEIFLRSEKNLFCISDRPAR